jgi:hypothetical protein
MGNPPDSLNCCYIAITLIDPSRWANAHFLHFLLMVPCPSIERAGGGSRSKSRYGWGSILPSPYTTPQAFDTPSLRL